MTDLELTFDNITPQHLKDNKAIAGLLKLYNSLSQDTSDILENPLDILDTDFLISKFEETENVRFDDIRKELFKIHLQEIYQTFEEIGESEEIYKKFAGVYEALGISPDELKIVADIDKSINSEYLNAADSFKTKKGTIAGFFFVYDIINRAGIQAINDDAFFRLIEGTKENPRAPYEYTVETSLYREVFDRTVVPLAHPVGFNWNFIRLLFLMLEDYFGLEQIKALRDTRLTCFGEGKVILNQQEIVDSKIYGTVKNFTITVDQNKREQVIIDYNPLDGTEGNGLRLLRDFDSSITLFDRQSVKVLRDAKTGEPTGQTQYLEITDIRLVHAQQGELTVNKVQRTLLEETFEVIESISFKEYSIVDAEFLDIEYRIREGEDKWNIARIPLTDKVVSSDIKYFEPKEFSRNDIFVYSLSYNGRIVEAKGTNCLLTYKASYSYKVSTKDIHEYIENIRPRNKELPRDVNDIDIPQSEYDIAVSEGRDPYEGKYSNIDHTMEEYNLYYTNENFGRLTIGNIPKQYSPYKHNGDISIDDPRINIDEHPDIDEDSDWRVNWGELHVRDLGFNPNNPTGPRWENFYIPEAQASLDIIGSTTPVQRFIRENLEWAGDKGSSTMPEGFGTGYIPSTSAEEDALVHGIKTLSEDYLGVIRLQGNGEYIAWEDFNIDISYAMTSNVNLQSSAEIFEIVASYDIKDIIGDFTDSKILTMYINDKKIHYEKWINGGIEIVENDSEYNVDDGTWAIGYSLYKSYESENYRLSWITENEDGVLDDSEFEDFTFEVYRDDVLLEDNNVSALDD